jgi:hypothetical protein
MVDVLGVKQWPTNLAAQVASKICATSTMIRIDSMSLVNMFLREQVK